MHGTLVHSLLMTTGVKWKYLPLGRLGVVGNFEALGRRVAEATARAEAVFPFALRAAPTCLIELFASAFPAGFPWIHVLRIRQASWA